MSTLLNKDKFEELLQKTRNNEDVEFEIRFKTGANAVNGIPFDTYTKIHNTIPENAVKTYHITQHFRDGFRIRYIRDNPDAEVIKKIPLKLTPESKQYIQSLRDDYNLKIGIANEKKYKESDVPIDAELTLLRYQKRISWVQDDLVFELSLVVQVTSTDDDFEEKSIYIDTLFDNPEKSQRNIDYETYEFEMEINEKTSFLNIDKHVKNILSKFIQNSDVIIDFPNAKNVLNNYGSLVKGNKKLYTPRFVGVMPVTLTIDRLELLKSKYAVAIKADGERELLYCDSNGYLYYINRQLDVKSLGIKSDVKDCLLDGELIENGNYLAYDIIVYKKNDLRGKKDHNLIDRLRKLESIIKQLNIKHILLKNYLIDGPLSKSIEKILNTTHTFKTDGLIFTPIDKPYPVKMGGWEYLLKWKTMSHSTIDFSVRLQKTESSHQIWHLFIQSAVYTINNNDVILIDSKKNNYTFFSLKDKKVFKKTFNNFPYNTKKEDKLLFFQPYHNFNAGVTCIPTNFAEKLSLQSGLIVECAYLPVLSIKNFKSITSVIEIETHAPHNLMNGETIQLMDIENVKDTFYNVIVKSENVFSVSGLIDDELYFVVHEKYPYTFIPNRIRYDKKKPNFIGSGMEVWDSIVNNVTKDMLIQSSGKQVNTRSSSPVIASKQFHNWIKSQMISLYGSNGRLLDLGSGRGGDMQKWISAGIIDVVGIELSKYAIQEAEKRYKPNKSKININYFQGDLSQVDVSKLLKEHNIDALFDCVTCNFAIHYFFTNINNISNLLLNVSKSLKTNGHFLVTVFNGKMVYDLLKNEPNLLYTAKHPITNNNIFQIQGLYNPLLKFEELKKVNNLINVSIADAVLSEYKGTNESSGQADINDPKKAKKEPIVNIDTLIELCDGHDLEFVQENSLNFSKFYNSYLFYKKQHEKEMTQEEKIFSFMYTTLVFRKK